MRIAEFDRQEFLSKRWLYKPGQHVTMSGPTGEGKTHLTFELLRESAHSQLPAVFFQMKPRDETIEEWARQLKYKEVGSWPPSWWHTQIMKPTGWVLKPPISFNPDVDEARQYYQFKRAMIDCYRKGNRIVVGDELYGLADLGLARPMIALWSRARSMGTGFWGGVQKPSHIPLWGFNQAEHVFLSSEPDIRNIKRFSEFGGVDPKIIETIVPRLEKFQMLYLRRSGRVACIVNP